MAAAPALVMVRTVVSGCALSNLRIPSAVGWPGGTQAFSRHSHLKVALHGLDVWSSCNTLPKAGSLHL
eukprot:2082696-Amphidinium_carterae.1